MRFDAPLPKFSAALAAGRPVRIVALGSSSTQGIGASSPKACYPVKLQAELQQRFPQNKILVENLGIGGQLASDMLQRIKKDVIPRKPTLVIWQTGVNDALRFVPVDKFRETVVTGIDLLQRAGIDVVLLDMQYFPKAEKVRDFPRFLVAMRQIAEQRRIPILQRFAIMKHFVTSAQYTPQQLLAADQFHPNDLSYRCLGRMMADALEGEVADVAKTAVKAKHPAEPAKQAGAVAPLPVH
ncbi:MAG: SGNH/GDSL hydrolase family protein [Hyphomicrobium sp.]|uniref:SGNH/GDSL hydrolase family protein n=1 Tax=Hyphomicrobium sp. TaxID=82 RepID=UPI0025B96A3B|nr:SGNH/GDSL hydrolase family protein [Hyphomicrobium sp.]MBZ0211830.1 SGNH/GDSL hydrolase family protein [Hyphomicrobium sp.]